jgi:hypothetical protein
MIAPTNSHANPSLDLHDQFLDLLPKIEIHARIYFRGIKCADQRADKIRETVAMAWKEYCHLVAHGKDVSQFPMVFISLVARGVKCGRRLAGADKAKDVMNPHTQRRRGFRVEPLPISTRTSLAGLYGEPDGQRELDAYEERLQDNTITPPPDQAAFRIDWPRFLKTLTKRDRELAHFLSLGHGGKKAADRFGLSPGRVTQLRQRWCREWRLSQGEETFEHGTRSRQKEAAA